MQTFPSIHHDKGYTMLSELKINLNHNWFQHVATSNAVAKHDMAAVDNSL